VIDAVGKIYTQNLLKWPKNCTMALALFRQAGTPAAMVFHDKIVVVRLMLCVSNGLHASVKASLW